MSTSFFVDSEHQNILDSFKELLSIMKSGKLGPSDKLMEKFFSVYDSYVEYAKKGNNFRFLLFDKPPTYWEYTEDEFKLSEIRIFYTDVKNSYFNYFYSKDDECGKMFVTKYLDRCADRILFIAGHKNFDKAMLFEAQTFHDSMYKCHHYSKGEELQKYHRKLIAEIILNEKLSKVDTGPLMTASNSFIFYG